ncbi:MAG: tRNA preQ1(34) S-adenosylmethionine ribosyltransferase-isomerase QueA [Bacillota bacterium]
MKTSDFTYDLPLGRIAQQPSEKRDASRLMVVHRDTHTIEHRRFTDILDYLRPGDALVINTTRVMPARLLGRLQDTGGKAEILLTRPYGHDVWEVMAKPAKRFKTGRVIDFGAGLTGEVTEELDEGLRVLRFSSEHKNVYDAFEETGHLPLPPYIKEKPKDESRYQTVYAKQTGSAAAPTAGLHFTPVLLDKVKERGVQVLPVLLHVGLGTFKPVQTEEISAHRMHEEYYEISAETADGINAARAVGGRIIAVGTTSVRTLESAADESGNVRAGSGTTGIFITPGYRFKAVDALVTNFHLPKSTLLMLVSAFYTREDILNAYAAAIEEGYRFFSFGDAMLIL